MSKSLFIHNIGDIFSKKSISPDFCSILVSVISHPMKYLTLIFVFCALSYSAIAQVATTDKVMLIGEQDQYYEGLVTECGTMLLTVSDNSMENAFALWNNLLADMEDAAETENFDIKGVKVWINCFWNEDGSIKNIFYYPKPTSKNMDFAQLTTFLNDFAETYVLPSEFDSCFSHYGSGSWPVRSRLQIEEK